MHKVYSVFGDEVYVDGLLLYKNSDTNEQLKFLKEKFEPTKDFWIGPSLNLDYDYFIDKSLLSLTYGCWSGISDFSTVITEKEKLLTIFNYIKRFLNSQFFDEDVQKDLKQLANLVNVEYTLSNEKNPYKTCCEILSLTEGDYKTWLT